MMSRTRRLREEVICLLEEKETANTVEIFDHLNERFRWGATMNQVGNIMSKDSDSPKSGTSGAHSEVVYTPSVCGAFPKMKLPWLNISRGRNEVLPP